MDTTPIPASEAQPAANLSPIGRIFGVLFSPKSTFEDIVRKPSWAVPMILMMVVWFGLCATLVKRVDWLDYNRQQIEKNKFVTSRLENMTEEQKAAIYEQGVGRAKATQYTRGVIGWPLLILISAAINFGAFKLIAGVRTNFGTAFAITTFAYLPVSFRELLAIPVTFLKDPQSIDPENFLASNAAALLGDNAPLWQIISLRSLDVFTIWGLILIAIGFSAADSKKAPLGKAVGISFGTAYSLVLLFTMLAWIFL